MARIQGLRKPAGALLIPRKKAELLRDIKSFILSKLEQKFLMQRQIRDCFVFHMNEPSNVTEECRQQVTLMRQTTREAYPLLRKNMAIMEEVNHDGTIDPDIEHPQNIH